MNKTGIEYLTYTWNPLAMRCTKVSPACDNCWHLRMADRLSKNPTISAEKRAAYSGTGPCVLRKDEMHIPSRMKKPAVIGVQFMGDLFHESVTDRYREVVFNVMKDCPWHTFLLLTKRADRMLEWYSDFWHFNHGITHNIWPGVTVEDQDRADERIPILLQIPAAVHFVSCEPLIGEVDLSKWL